MRWLIDEMLPPGLESLLCEVGHDAVSVSSLDMRGASDVEVFELAVSQARVVVTENFADFARMMQQRHARSEPCTPVAFVRKPDRGASGSLAVRLAERLHAWAKDNPDPYVGLHWP